MVSRESEEGRRKVCREMRAKFGPGFSYHTKEIIFPTLTQSGYNKYMTQRQKELIFKLAHDALINSPAWSTSGLDISAEEICDLIPLLKLEIEKIEKIENTTAHNQWEIFVAQMERLDHAYDLLDRRIKRIESRFAYELEGKI